MFDLDAQVRDRVHGFVRDLTALLTDTMRAALQERLAGELGSRSATLGRAPTSTRQAARGPRAGAAKAGRAVEAPRASARGRGGAAAARDAANGRALSGTKSAGNGGSARPQRTEAAAPKLPTIVKLPPSRRGQRRAGGRTHGEAIVAALETMPKGAHFAELREALGRMGHAIEPGSFATALQILKKSGRIRADGPRRSMRYSLGAGESPRAEASSGAVPPVRRPARQARD